MRGSVQPMGWISSIALCVMLIAPHAQAQIRLPGSAEAGRSEQEALSPSIPTAKSTAQPSLGSAPSSQALVPPEGADKVWVTLTRLDIEGATRYTPEELLAPVGPILNQRITVARLYEVASSILTHYRNDGYGFVLVYLPPQTIDKGIAKIRIVEGHISRVAFDGVQETPAIREAVHNLQAETPLSSITLEEQMLRINDLPGIQAKAVLSADKENGKEGALLLTLTGTDVPISGSVAFNNYGSRYIGQSQSIASVSGNNLLGNNDRTTLSGFSALPYREGHFASIEHREQIDLATSVGIRISKSHNRPGYNLEPQEIRSKTISVALDTQYQYLRSRAENLGFNARFELGNYDTTIIGTRLYEDNIRALRIGATYDTVDRWNGTSAVNVTVSQGLNIFGARKTGSTDLSRAEGHSGFTKVEATAWHSHPLPEAFSLYTLASGQLASDPLLSAEEFGFGGSTLGRAYDIAEITGDHGLAGTVELRYLGIPKWQDTLLQPFAFYDAGWIWNMDTGGKRELAASSGLGMRALVADSVQVNATLAYPLKREVQAPQTHDRDDPRFNIGVSYNF